MDRLCRIRDIQHAVNHFDREFSRTYGICLNEGMVLCSLLKADRLSAGELGELLCLSPSNTSKVIRSAEEKGLVGRVYGDRDRRQMYFSLTDKGRRLISSVRCEDVEMPPLLGCIIKDIPSD